MEPLSIVLIVLALAVGLVLGRLSRRPASAPEPLDDPRLPIERNRADAAEAKVDSQAQELQEWAASHRVLEGQVADLQAELKDTKEVAATGGDEAKQRIEELEAKVGSLGDAADQLEAAQATSSALEAKVTQLEGQIEAGAGSVTKDTTVELAKRDERIGVLRVRLEKAERMISDLERRLES
jgi:predicted RNase H-like nuclease (RuvC/YqgF family)